jgi:hypothetical protein
MVILDEGAPEHVEATDRRTHIPCSPGCQGRHLRVWTQPGKLHIELGAHDPPALPGDLAEALKACGYSAPVVTSRTGVAIPPKFLPSPPSFNEPLRRSPT